MKQNTKALILSGILAILFPILVLKVTKLQQTDSNEGGETTVSQLETNASSTTEAKEKTEATQITVLVSDGTAEHMLIDDYIAGVILAEMPAQFDQEALKAQAVVARTYTLKRHFGDSKHNSQAVCTDPSCCQAYCSPKDYLENGGTQALFDKVKNAVKQTEYLVLTYGQELIEATYFSCSGGRTEDAQAVWGADVPYLRSVESPGEESAAYYMETVYFTLQEFADCLQIQKDALSGRWLGEITYTNGGGVKNIAICGKTYTGTQLRSLLGLRSTAFVISSVGNTVTVTTKGFGHRVGMSQYGAEAMAVNGSTYKEILAYYYPGTELMEFTN